MISQKAILRSFFCTLLILPIIHADVIVWDVGQVLIDFNINNLFDSYSFTDRLKGYCSATALFFAHPLTNFKKTIKNAYLQELNNVRYQSKSTSVCYADDGKTPLPALLNDLMLGLTTYQEARALWYMTPKTDLLNKIFELSFNPQRFVDAQVPRMETIKLLQQCATQLDQNGNKKHVCILISNWDADAVPYFKAKFADTIIKYIDFEHSIFSGCVHCVKPDKSIYELLKQKIRELPNNIKGEIFFFDDQEVNRDAARECIPEIICAHPDHALTLLRVHEVIT